MRVFVTGATGFVGRHLVSALLEQGHQVHALVRPGSAGRLPKAAPKQHLTTEFGDVLDEQQIRQGMDGCGAVIHLVGIIREFPQKGITFNRLHVQATENVLRVATDKHITRYLQMSALGAARDSPSGYFQTKAQAEDLVKKSGLSYTIVRPSIIFGPGDDFISYFAGIMRRFHLIPIIGAGKYRMQPVYVEDVCQVFARALDSPGTVETTYEIAGRERFRYTDMMQVVKQVMRIRAVSFHTPQSLMAGLAKLFGHYPFFPITRDQIIMLYDENITDDTRAYELLDIVPTPFREGLETYLSSMD